LTRPNGEREVFREGGREGIEDGDGVEVEDDDDDGQNLKRFV
jgi:hypothetical protein